MIEFIARFSSRLRAVLELFREVENLLIAVEDILHDRGSDPRVQAVLNRMRDARHKFDMLRGG